MSQAKMTVISNELHSKSQSELIDMIHQRDDEIGLLKQRIIDLNGEIDQLRDSSYDESIFLPEIDRETFLGQIKTVQGNYNSRPLEQRDIFMIGYYAMNENRFSKKFRKPKPVTNSEISDVFQLSMAWVSQLLKKFVKHEYLFKKKKLYYFTHDKEKRSLFRRIYKSFKNADIGIPDNYNEELVIWHD